MSLPRDGEFEPRQIWERTVEPIFWLDQALRLIWVNRAWETLTGYSADRVLGLRCQERAADGSADLIDLAAGLEPPPEALAGQPVGTVARLVSASGETIWRRLDFWPFPGDERRVIGMLGLLRPIDSCASLPSTELSALRAALLEARRDLEMRHGFDALIGSGPAHERLLAQVALAASVSAPVLIVGEGGTGKGRVARAIHQQGSQKLSPFVSFDCEALPPEILEREIFGAEPQATNGPSALKTARAPTGPALSLPDGGTMLLREVARLPRDLQSRLLAALASPVRLLATMSTEPEVALRNDSLRPDLYFALTTLVIRLAPLRERAHDVPLLAQHLLEQANLRGGVARCGFRPEAMAALMNYDWPGNLSEMARVIDHAHAHSQESGPLIAVEDLPAAIQGNLGAAYCPPGRVRSIKPLDVLLADVERRLIETALRQAKSNKSRAAELLGISRPRLYRRIKELNLPDDSDPGDDADAGQ
jgi:PAS domain S-box-containing protein